MMYFLQTNARRNKIIKKEIPPSTFSYKFVGSLAEMTLNLSILNHSYLPMSSVLDKNIVQSKKAF